jgi:hypothetical protein
MIPAPPVRLLRGVESYEVRYTDGRASRYFYFETDAGRRVISRKMSPAEAQEAARAFARQERDRIAREPAKPACPHCNGLGRFPADGAWFMCERCRGSG